MQSSGGLEEYLWGDCPITWATSEDKPIEATPIYHYFRKLSKQCETFLAGASRMLADTQGEIIGEDAGEDMETTIKGTSLCGEIIAAREDLERAMQALGRDVKAWESSPASTNDEEAGGKGKSVDPAIQMERQYRQMCERLAFQHLSFPRRGEQYVFYNYDTELQSSSSATRNPKDRLHLIKELAVMATSLPAGVWVRVDEVRNDALFVSLPMGFPRR